MRLHQLILVWNMGFSDLFHCAGNLWVSVSWSEIWPWDNEFELIPQQQRCLYQVNIIDLRAWIV
jgi:hypothetical protein